MKPNYFYFSLLLFLMALGLNGCSENTQEPSMPETPDISDQPIEQLPDTLLVRIGASFDITESPFETRTGNSQDLIGVEITRKTSGSPTNELVSSSVIYASGVFDDIEDVVFKFVRGGTYLIKMTYFPMAKDIVYNYPDGTFGAPFSDIFGLQEYSLNQPVYYSGVEGGWSGDQGPQLLYLLDDTYQPTSDRHIQSFFRGTTPRYSGMTDYFTIEDNTDICVNLELCMMSISLEPDNFTEGELSLCYRNYMYMSDNNAIWKVKPGDNMTTQLQVPFKPGEESLELFYSTPKGEKYLLATKQLQRKHRTNFTFRFKLTERADGSIGIQMPSDESFENEDMTFDF